tara:strand:+ start:3924 stop:4376 length:453 start_codon:yes stop_codon:yes gene_type:complete
MRDHKKELIVAIIVLVLVLGGVYFFSSLRKVDCQGFSCFQENMRRCTKASYINEEPEASWRYDILESRKGNCVVAVDLLQTKEGTLDTGRLKGLSMECSYPKGVGVYPEKDLSKCHGRLKEELQTIIIEKLHVHIIDNLGSIDQNLNKAV